MSQIKVPIVLTRDTFVISAILCLLLPGLINANVEEKLGRCPSKGLIEISQCVDNLLDECATDVDCEGAAKCCSTGCKKACVLPDLSTCQRIQVEFQKRARALGLDVDTLAPPRCLPEGKFEPVQCNDTVCWCVDDSGFEMAGTRARALEQLDCKNPRPCAGFNCRMLCPYGFDLDYDGCPLCRCKDPCKGIKCPGAQACQLEEVPCEKEPCAPIPTCKQARSLDSLCPLGLPLTLAGGDKPYLCGTEAGKPDCPKDFNCHVSPGAEYGVCCAALDQMVKPGTCQISGPAECGVPCGSDLDCAGADKCCSSEGCGKTCMPPQNLTVCRQQQAFTELMNTHQLESKGYVPQCTADGKFEARQCSKNGLVCWCVDEHSGVMLRGSIGPAAGVHCNNFITAEKTFSTLVEKSRSDCGTNLCPRTCQYGYKTDPNGCQLCECEDPCMNFKCPNGFKCEKIKEEGCDGSRCPVKPDCKEVFVEPCSQGPYLTNDVTKEPIRCSVGSKFSCPSLYNCVLSIQHNATFCCPKREDDVTGRKNSDVMPTVCQVMKRLSETQGRDLANKGLSLSLMEPRCSPSGEFEPLQCDRESCWCVDEFGMEIPRTRGPKGVVKDCKRSRNDVDCEGSSMCRLGCDFGFVMDPNSNCPKCECRDPCETLNCPEDKICKIMTPSCEKGDCPRLPFCIDSNRRSSDIQEEEEEEGAFSSLSCPGDNYTGKIVTCKIRGRSMNCPTGFGCYSNTTVEGALGICCPVAADLPKKQGQCPFLVPTSTSCDISCVTDLDCEGSSKCCANGCGTQCTAPLLKTGCELERDIMSHRAKESGFPTNRVYLPKCDVNGKYEKIQCHPWTRICWCADNTGREIEKTRTPPGIKPTCDSDKQTDVCEVFKCKLNCPYGYALDTAGCPLCKCKNPCDKIRCGEKQICKMIQLNCTNDACPYLPICVPRKDKPCPYGNPLYDSTGVPSKCGPLGKGCPSSHKCLLDPFGEIAVCCPKPRETCAEEQDDGSSQCSSHTSRWYFNAKSNRCEQFSYTGCGGNLNNFESEQDCRTTCPVLTSCQKLREKNLRLIEKYKKIVFLPKCKEGGEFDSTQCLDELGLCWCVDKHGEAMKGTLTRGKPICSVRQARQHSLDREICEDGITAHVCDKSICDEKVCIADPSATCKINPCGGCKAEFYDARGSIVDCAAGLTTCQARIQEIINSPSWYRQDLEYSQNRDAELLPNFYTDVFNKQHSEMKEMNVDKPPRRKRQSFSSIDDDIFDLLALESYNEQSAPQVRTTTGEEFIGTIGSVDALSEFMIERPNLESTRYVNDAIKAGDCPAVRQPSLLRILAQMSNQCIDKCVSDADCPGPLRCCPGQCGDACQLPILPKAPVTKPGQCPIGPKACDDSLQKTNCRRDWDCPSTFKCCDNECGKVCIEPEDADSLPSKFFLVPPRCLESGQFSREQRQGELSWCMTADGVPIQGSLTRGFVRCAENGTVLERLSLGPICPSPDQAPKICTTECLHASCPGHKDAVCIADPCNGCRTAFYNSDGDEVSCEPICSQKIEKGMCRSSLQRWGFDPNSRQCEEFFYGGCGGNENNFDSLQKCQDTCKTIDRCSLPKNTGSCAKEAKRWFYNSGSQKCEEFIYTGCGGNANNFLTKEECEMTCPDLVMCPKLPNVNGEIPICSRSEVCEKEGCPDEDVVCTVDPCTCAPIFKNRKGKRVNCPFHSESGENYQSDVPIPNEIMRSGNMPLMKIIPAEVVTETAEEKMMRDKSKKIETEVIRMYNPAKEFVVRSDQKKIGKLTKQKKPKAMNLDVTAVMTRCKKMRQKMVEEKSSFVVDCDKQGRFAPTQCYMGTPSVCWCVDESGNQLKDTTMFMSGNRTCHYVPVKAVNVSLSIPMHDNHHPETNQIRKEIDLILNKLNVEIELYEPEMNHDEVRINFTLTGDNKIDAADYIEEMVRNGEFQVLMGDEIMPADYTSSKFVHVSGSPVLRQQRKLNFETLENREIIAEPLNKDVPYFAIILTMCIVSSFLILALIISLLLYRKKTTGEYPKGGGAPLAYGVHCRGKTEDIIPRGFPRVGLDDKEFQRSKPLSPVLPRFMKSGNTESMKL